MTAAMTEPVAAPVRRMCECGHPASRHDQDGCRSVPVDRDAFACTCSDLRPVYGMQEVVDLAGATYRELDHWLRLIKAGTLPDVVNERASGTGSRRWFTADELATIRLIVHLRHFGIELRRAFQIAGQMEGDGSYTAAIADVYSLTVQIRDTGGQP